MELLQNDPELKEQLINLKINIPPPPCVLNNQSPLDDIKIINSIIDQLPSSSESVIAKLKNARQSLVFTRTEKTKTLIKDVSLPESLIADSDKECRELIRSIDDTTSDHDILAINEIYNIMMQTKVTKASNMLKSIDHSVRVAERKRNNERSLLIVVIIFVLIGIYIISRMILNWYRGGSDLNFGNDLLRPSSTGPIQGIYQFEK